MRRRCRDGLFSWPWLVALGHLKTAACLIVVAAAVALIVILAPWRPSPSPSQRSPGTVLDDVAAREWIGTLFYDRTFTQGRKSSILLTLSVDPSPSRRPGASVGFILYGEGCPSESVALIRNDPRVLTLAAGPLAGPVTPSCRGSSSGALLVLGGLRPVIRIALAGADPQAGISVLADTGKSGTIYRATLHISD